MTNQQIRKAYTDLGGNGAYISLAKVRAHLSHLSRAEIDAALYEMIDDDDVSVEPETSGFRIGPAEKAAAIVIGGEDHHLLRIGR